MPHDKPNPREVALDILSQVLEHGRALIDLLESDQQLTLMSSRDRAFARLLVFTVLRRLGQLDDLINRKLNDPQLGGTKTSGIVRNILRLGTTQLIFLKTPPHAAVDSSVNLAKVKRVKRFEKLINAVLRRISESGHKEVKKQDAGRLNTPDWLWNRWIEDYGVETTREIAAAHLVEPPLDISVKNSPGLWAKRLKAKQLPTGSLRRPTSKDIISLPGYANGDWWIQDAAAALPVHLLGDVSGKTVIDLCAAPGGKTAQLAAKGANVIAVDRSSKRLRRLQSNLDRLNLWAKLVVADATKWRPAISCDAVLLDAPCTATGTIRRHPDIAHTKFESDITRMALLQNQLILSAINMLRPGGILVYTVCSLDAEEGLNIISSKLASGAPVATMPVKETEVPTLSDAITSAGFVRTTPALWPKHGGLDGFFVARLKRLRS